KLYNIEWDLRHAQAHDALHEIRQFLRFQSYVLNFKDRNLFGQGPSTRARTMLQSVNAKIDCSKRKYQTARRALVDLASKLGKVGWDGALKELADDDIKSMTTLLAGETEGRKKISWIWTNFGVASNDDKGLQDAVRMEWCRCRARAMRWNEEALLLQEEARRVLAFLKWQAQWWRDQGKRRLPTVSSEPLKEGIIAYAERQASIRTSLAHTFYSSWMEVPYLLNTVATDTTDV
ncbi:hypothetical protein BJ138DRAFT_1020105, partial [Hygrophoropsis aurantiaca]